VRGTALTHLERSLADQELGALLVLADLTKSDSSGTVTVGPKGKREGEVSVGNQQCARDRTMGIAARNHSSTHFLTPPAVGADLRAALVASCLRGAFPPVDLRAVCLVRAMVVAVGSERERAGAQSETTGEEQSKQNESLHKSLARIRVPLR
jgi:hypothetical protein